VYDEPCNALLKQIGCFELNGTTRPYVNFNMQNTAFDSPECKIHKEGAISKIFSGHRADLSYGQLIVMMNSRLGSKHASMPTCSTATGRTADAADE